MSPRHPLARKERITVHDLHGQKIMMYARGITRADDRLRDYIGAVAPDVQIIDIRHYGSSLPLDMTMDFPIDIGLGYRVDSNNAVKQFIGLAKSMYPFNK